MRSPTSKYLQVVLLATVGVTFLVYQAVYIYSPSRMSSMELYKAMKEERSDPRQSCQIPLHHPFEEDVLVYFSSARPLSCRSRTTRLSYVDKEGVLRYNSTAFIESGFSVGELNCVYQEITAKSGSDNEVEYSEEKQMTGSNKLESDFVYVACTNWLSKVYSMYHAHVQRRPHVRHFSNDEEVGVVVVGLDSVSRLNFMRQLPSSYHTLTETLHGTLMKGFNKVGENTFFNIVPILTGNNPLAHPTASTFDDWPFIWNVLNKDNMATLYGEDLAKIMTFSWFGDGFRSQPTTHYFRPFWVAVDGSSLNAFSSPLCLGPTPKHRIYIDYIKSFLRAYTNAPVFMFSLHNEPSHDYLNTVGVIDADFNEFLLSSYHEGLFNRTVLFILSDHGHRFDTFRNTKLGKIEDRMPLVSVVLPDWLSERYPTFKRHLHSNRLRLTSSFDLYATFLDIFRKFSGKNGSDLKFEEPKFGQSLFEPVPLSRTCKDAGIPDIYCVCVEESTSLTTSHPLVVDSANILLTYINDNVLDGTSSMWNTTLNQLRGKHKLQGQTTADTDLTLLNKCAKLTLEVSEANSVTKTNGLTLVHVAFETSPNSGTYEGTVAWWKSEGHVYQDIIRTNRYGTQADCMPRVLLTLVPLLRSVCICL